MGIYPAPLIPWIDGRFTDEEAIPLAGGLVYSYAAGSNFSVLQPTYSDVNLTLPNPNPIVLDVGGRSPTDIRLLPTGYLFQVQDVFGATVYTVDNVQDDGYVFASTWGLLLAQGPVAAASGYTVQPSDRLVRVASTGGPNPCIITLPVSNGSTQPVTIKNVGNVPISLQRSGADLIDNAVTSFTIPAASSPAFPAVQLVPDGVTAWWIVASHKVP